MCSTRKRANMLLPFAKNAVSPCKLIPPELVIPLQFRLLVLGFTVFFQGRYRSLCILLLLRRVLPSLQVGEGCLLNQRVRHPINQADTSIATALELRKESVK